MGYITTGIILNFNPEQNFHIHISHHDWFDKYNSQITSEYNNTPGYLILQKYPESMKE